jgi:Na+-transporting NADH:ubiquinone oxidoreductase subunit NqrB
MILHIFYIIKSILECVAIYNPIVDIRFVEPIWFQISCTFLIKHIHESISHSLLTISLIYRYIYRITVNYLQYNGISICIVWAQYHNIKQLSRLMRCDMMS